MKVFIDTEFSSLQQHSSRLISLALVSEDGRELYVEMPAHTWRLKASEFVIENVEPFLWGGSYEAKDSADFCQRVREFLTDIGHVMVVTDAPNWDMGFLMLTLEVDKQGWPKNVATSAVYFNPESTEEFSKYWEDSAHFRHHALHDARALREAWLASTKKRSKATVVELTNKGK